MPNRMLRDWTQSDKIDVISVEAERFFTRLIMKADDYGCFWGDTRLLKANLFPLKLDKIREADITRWIAECVKAGLILFYEVDQKKYLQIVDFGQRLDKSRSKFPLPDGQSDMNKTYVYVMHNPDSSLHKIGYSANPWARLKEIKSSVGEKVVITMMFAGTMDEERELHKLLRNYNVDGEWFNLPKDVINCFSEFKDEKKSAYEVIVSIRNRIVPDRTPSELEKNTNTKQKEKENAPTGSTHTPDQIELFNQFSDWLSKYFPRVTKMKKPITIDEYLKLRETINRETLTKLLTAMENRADLHKKYVSAYLTIINWSKNEFNQPEQRPEQGSVLTALKNVKQKEDAA